MFFWGQYAAMAAISAYQMYRQGKEAEKSRDWQRRMSSSAHQREVADLRAAGLNPILSVTGGSGASTPSGAVAKVPDLQKAVSSALAAKQMDAVDAEISLKKSQEGVNSATRLKIESETTHVSAKVEKTLTETQLLRLEEAQRRITGDSAAGRLMNTIGRAAVWTWDQARRLGELAKKMGDEDRKRTEAFLRSLRKRKPPKPKPKK